MAAKKKVSKLNRNLTKNDKLKIAQRLHDSVQIFSMFTLEHLREIEKTGKVNCSLDEKDVIAFSCSSTDRQALKYVISVKERNGGDVSQPSKEE